MPVDGRTASPEGADSRVSVPLSPFDHHAPDHRVLWAPQVDAIRVEGPVGWTNANGGHWIIVGHQAVREAALDWETFSSLHDTTGRCPYAKGIGIPPFPFPLILSESDPPISTERRMLELPFFKLSEIRAREPIVEAHAQASMEAMAEQVEVDLFRDYAMPVVAKTTMELVGIDLSQWSNFTLAVHHGSTEASFDLSADVDRVHAILLELVRERRRAPKDDIVSALVRGKVAGELLRDDEVLSMLSALVLGGFDTTASMITNALIWLADHRSTHEALFNDPTLLRNAADEFLRISAPSLGGARNVTRSVEFHSVQMSAGDRVLLSWAGANRDPGVFDSPHDIRLDRPNASQHLTFGIGPHRCLGADLARLIGRVAIRAMLERFPEYTICKDRLVPYQSPGGFVLGWSTVPARLGPSRALRRDAPA